jgi:hypothetical protein
VALRPTLSDGLLFSVMKARLCLSCLFSVLYATQEEPQTLCHGQQRPELVEIVYLQGSAVISS